MTARFWFFLLFALFSFPFSFYSGSSFSSPEIPVRLEKVVRPLFWDSTFRTHQIFVKIRDNSLVSHTFKTEYGSWELLGDEHLKFQAFGQTYIVNAYDVFECPTRLQFHLSFQANDCLLLPDLTLTPVSPEEFAWAEKVAALENLAEWADPDLVKTLTANYETANDYYIEFKTNYVEAKQANDFNSYRFPGCCDCKKENDATFQKLLAEIYEETKEFETLQAYLMSKITPRQSWSERLQVLYHHKSRLDEVLFGTPKQTWKANEPYWDRYFFPMKLYYLTPMESDFHAEIVGKEFKDVYRLVEATVQKAPVANKLLVQQAKYLLKHTKALFNTLP